MFGVLNIQGTLKEQPFPSDWGDKDLFFGEGVTFFTNIHHKLQLDTPVNGGRV